MLFSVMLHEARVPNVQVAAFASPLCRVRPITELRARPLRIPEVLEVASRMGAKYVQ
jgi:hypothetical protein